MLQLLLLAGPGNLPAQDAGSRFIPPADSGMARVVSRGTLLTYQNDFDGAEALFDSLCEAHPESPFGYFYRGATCQARMLDGERFWELENFKDLMAKTIDLAEDLRAERPEDPWFPFAAGSAYLYLGFMDTKKGGMWGAYRNTVKGVDLLEQALAIDSTFYDAYLGIGSFKYWKSSKAKSLTWLPFIDDERERGMEMVQIAIDKGMFTRTVGRDQLAWIYMDGKRYEEALELAGSNVSLHPESRFFRWTYVEILFRMDRWEEAFPVYQGLLNDIRALPVNNHYNEMTCLRDMAKIAHRRGETARAVMYLEEMLALDLSEAIAERGAHKTKEARKLLKEYRRELAASGE
ncbi:MAG TPA: tetratricopeptide repeat protein [Calditrichia bacterium]|nr:tetratricopeptide repeat protein [Calditrichia bacterium]